MITLDKETTIDPYCQFNRNHRSSIASTRSASSPYDSTNDHLSYNGEQPNIQRRPSKKGVSTFISKLYSMVEEGHHQNLISWNPSGTSFFVCNATQFAQEVLPEYFKHSNFSSFVRLLNMYGFHKINKSPRGQRGSNENEIWEFSHPKFQHGRYDFLNEIKRKAMDSELLRRETGDIHASFAMLQMSQADLLQQFYILQENFSSLLQSIEENKKIQYHQQAIIQQLAERQGMTQPELMQLQNDVARGNLQQPNTPPFDHLNQDSSVPNSSNGSPVTVFVTSPPNNDGPNDSYNPMQFFNDQPVLQHPLQLTPDVNMSMYDNSPSLSPLSPTPLDNPANMPLHPSVFLNTTHHDPSRFHAIKYDEMATTSHFGLSAPASS